MQLEKKLSVVGAELCRSVNAFAGKEKDGADNNNATVAATYENGSLLLCCSAVSRCSSSSCVRA